MRERARGGESGFSLIELMVAMTITLIISGAVYGLLTGGQNAFRREPEMTDRQQNIRLAMDRIMKDIGIAGNGFSPFFQSFGNGLNAAGPQGPSAATDYLEIYGNDGECPDVPGAQDNSSPGANIRTSTGIPSCFPEPGMVVVYYADGSTRWGWGFNIHGGIPDNMINFPPGQQPTGPPGPDSQIDQPPDLNGTAGVGLMVLIRYEIAPGPPDGAPSLWRSTKGGIDNNGDYVAASATPNTAGGWQLLARGIEDLQVGYRRGDTAGAFVDTPGVVTSPTYGTIVQEVRVTLSARSEARNLQGATKSALETNFGRLRGQLTSTGVPRAALLALQKGNQWH